MEQRIEVSCVPHARHSPPPVVALLDDPASSEIVSDASGFRLVSASEDDWTARACGTHTGSGGVSAVCCGRLLLCRGPPLGSLGGDATRSELRRNRISGSAWHGIRYDGAKPLVEGNLIYGNARSGIYASGKTAAEVRGNLFWRNEHGGMSCCSKTATRSARTRSPGTCDSLSPSLVVRNRRCGTICS